MNALCLPPALVFNRALAPDEVERFGDAIGGDAVRRARELARSAASSSCATSASPRTTCPPSPGRGGEPCGQRRQPAPGEPDEIEVLLESIW